MDSNQPIVLIVDDSPESIDVLRGVLGSEYRVCVAINGMKALEIAPNVNPDIILLDVMMPDMDGYETCKRLKAISSLAQTPIIFVTTLGETDSQLRGLELGAVDYITKPFAASLVKSRVRTHVSLYRHCTQLQHMVLERTEELLDTRLEIIRRLGRAAEYRDNETGMHVMRMSHMTRLLAIAHGVDEAKAEVLFQASPMHDVGKIGTPDHILLKPGKLSDEEWVIIKKHTTIGAEIIGDHPSELMSTARDVALRHHERWDGGGYPGGLKGEEIPLEARIVAIADVFDALLSVRPYKPAWPIEKAMQYMRESSGSHFDPSLLGTFLAILPDCLEVRERYRD
jgi:putative two-component system response regulator